MAYSNLMGNVYPNKQREIQSGISQQTVVKDVETQRSFMSKEKAFEIMTKGQQNGFDPKDVLDGIIRKGYTVEGYKPVTEEQIRTGEVDIKQNEIDTEADEGFTGFKSELLESAEQRGAKILEIDEDFKQRDIERQKLLQEAQDTGRPEEVRLQKFKNFFTNSFDAVKEPLFKTGEGAKIVGDTLWAGVSNLVQEFTPEVAEEVIESGVQSAVGSVLDTDTAKWTMQTYSDFKEKNPDSAQTIESVLGFADAFITLSGVGAGTKAGIQGLKSSTGNITKESLKQAGKNVLEKTGEIAKDIVTAPVTIPASVIRKVTPQKISNAIAGIDKGTASVLRKTSKERIQEVLLSAQEAVDDFKKSTPFAKVEEITDNVMENLKKKLDTANKQKNNSLKGKKDVQIDTEDLITDLDDMLSSFNLEIDGNGVVKVMKDKISKIDAKEVQGFADEFLELKTIDNISTQNLDSLVDKLQSKINFNKINRVGGGTTSFEKKINKVIGKLNSKLKQVVGESYTKANKDLSNLIDLKNRFEKMLGSNGSKIESLMKASFSPQRGESVKKVFREILDETGVDLIDESVLAKFAMEAVGDTRAFNLLNALDLGPGFSTSKAGLVQKALQSILSPEKVGKSLGTK